MYVRLRVCVCKFVLLSVSESVSASDQTIGGTLRETPMCVVAVGETVILLHPPRPLVGVSIGMERECQQNDSLADG